MTARRVALGVLVLAVAVAVGTRTAVAGAAAPRAAALEAAEPGLAPRPRAQEPADPGAALRAAASHGDVAAVQALLAAGEVDVDAANQYGATALILACNRGNAEMVRVLLAAGADPDRADDFYRMRPLQWAAMRQSAEIVALLFEHGAEGYAELFDQAVAAGDVERVGYLLSLHLPEAEVLGASLQQAQQAGNTELVRLLRSVGAEPPPPPVFDISVEALRRYAGSYVDEVGYTLEVSADLENRKLLIKPLGLRNALAFYATEENVFVSEQSTEVVAVFNLSDGRVVSMLFRQAGDSRRLMKR